MPSHSVNLHQTYTEQGVKVNASLNKEMEMFRWKLALLKLYFQGEDQLYVNWFFNTLII